MRIKEDRAAIVALDVPGMDDAVGADHASWNACVPKPFEELDR